MGEPSTAASLVHGNSLELNLKRKAEIDDIDDVLNYMSNFINDFDELEPTTSQDDQLPPKMTLPVIENTSHDDPVFISSDNGWAQKFLSTFNEVSSVLRCEIT